MRAKGVVSGEAVDGVVSGAAALPRGAAAVLAALLLFVSSSMLFHESASWVLDYTTVFGIPLNIRGHSCSAHSAGLVLGYAISQIRYSHLKKIVIDIRFWVVVFAVQLMCVITFYGMVNTPEAAFGVIAVQLVSAALGALFFVVCSQVVCFFSAQAMLLAIMVVLGGSTFIVQGAFSVLETSTPLVVSEALHAAMVIAAGALMVRALAPGSCFRRAYEDKCFEPVRNRYRDDAHRIAPYFCLFAIVGAYALVFGFMHVVPLAVPLDVHARVMTFLLGIVAALALFVITVRAQEEIDVSHIWNRFYRFVFPVVVLAALLGPLTTNSEYLPSLVMQAWALYFFDALLATACFAIARAINAAPSQVFGRAFLVRAVGFLVGNLIGMTAHDNFDLGSTQLLTFAAVEFVLLVAVTFNTNSERYAKTVWGLLPHEDPRGKFDRLLDERCAELARDCGFTKRESEVLVLTAHGKRPKDISEELVVSVATVRSHVRNIYNKAEVHSHEELMRLLEEGRPSAE